MSPAFLRVLPLSSIPCYSRVYIYISPSIFVIVYPSSSSYSATPEGGVNQNRRAKKSLSVYANYRAIAAKKKLRNGARQGEKRKRTAFPKNDDFRVIGHENEILRVNADNRKRRGREGENIEERIDCIDLERLRILQLRAHLTIYREISFIKTINTLERAKSLAMIDRLAIIERFKPSSPRFSVSRRFDRLFLVSSNAGSRRERKRRKIRCTRNEMHTFLATYFLF